MPKKPTKPLTKTAVDAGRKLAKDSGSLWIGDSETPGFGARCYASGSVTFCLRYRTEAGVQRVLKVATYPAVTVEEARRMARAATVEIHGRRDPQAERQRAAVEIDTVRTLVTRWLTEYARAHRKRWKEDRYRVDRAILPALGRLRLEDVTANVLAGWHRKVGKSSPVQANRSLETLRAAWRWAEKEGLLAEALPDPTRRVKKFREYSRDRWLRKEEVARLMAAVRDESDPFIRAAVPLLLLTGLRKRELLHARWSDVDLERGEIRLPSTKSGNAQIRLLPAPAVTLLRDLPRIAKSPYVFPRPSDPAKPRDDLKKPWERIRKAAGLEDVTLHDLRRTAGSHMAQAGVPLQVIQEVLGQSHPGVTRIYARLASENERDALDTLSNVLAGSMGLSPASPPPNALPHRLQALLDATKDDPDALAKGLRALGLGEAVEA